MDPQAFLPAGGTQRREAERRATPRIAYFSMEVGIEAALPTYSGGLGILAGDTLRAAADQGLPLLGVTLIHREGYFRQRLDADGRQREEPTVWSPEEVLERVPIRVQIEAEGRPLLIGAWRHDIAGTGGVVPVFFLDTGLPENEPEFQRITNRLYGGDERMRLLQETVLGIGGIALLRALGHGLTTYHMNEGHSALLALALVEEAAMRRGIDYADPEAVEDARRRCVFTTHTPVEAGHDCFDGPLVRTILGDDRAERLEQLGCMKSGTLNMTHLALRLSHYVNGVAMRHRQVSTGMFPAYSINAITNGVHAATWASPPFQRLFDQMIPEWRRENFNLRYAVGIDPARIADAHAESKAVLLADIAARTGRVLDPAAFTIVAARRATPYKRADLVLSQPDRLRAIVEQAGPLQLVFAGKAHPRDEGGKEIIRRIHAAAEELDGAVTLLYLENYDITLARLLVSGADLWLNTPLKPLEASGTSGMKAALNGVPSLSVLDGWWIEGWVEGVTGWSIGEAWDVPSDSEAEAATLYDKLERVILPLYYGTGDGYARVRQACIALNGSFFTAERMIGQYARGPYGLRGRVWDADLAGEADEALERLAAAD